MTSPTAQIDIKKMYISLAIVSAVLLAISFYWSSWQISYSLGLGLLVGGANFYLIIKLVKIFMGAQTMSRFKTVLFFLLKILLLFGIIGLILLKGHVSSVPFLIGISNAPLAILFVGLQGFGSF